MKSSVLRFGQVGRCSCGDIGRRRTDFADEPICDPCLPGRRSFLKMSQGTYKLAIGRLTPAQRAARIKWLTTSIAREVELCVIRDEIHASAIIEAEPEVLHA